jgi:hypothetical protein
MYTVSLVCRWTGRTLLLCVCPYAKLVLVTSLLTLRSVSIPSFRYEDVKLSLCVLTYYAVKAYEAVKLKLYAFLNLALEDGGERYVSRPGHFYRAPRIRWMGGWVVPQDRSGRFGEQKNFSPLPGIETRFIDYPTPSVLTIPVFGVHLEFSSWWNEIHRQKFVSYQQE